MLYVYANWKVFKVFQVVKVIKVIMVIKDIKFVNAKFIKIINIMCPSSGSDFWQVPVLVPVPVPAQYLDHKNKF